MEEVKEHEYDERLNIIKDIMSGIPIAYIRKAQEAIKQGKEENTFHFIKMRYLDAYEKIYDALERRDNKIRINYRTNILLEYPCERLCIIAKCVCNNLVSERTFEEGLNNIHRLTCRILSMILKDDTEFFKV